ncbi:hypothetical protein [Simkania sp.]|uniref:hypothetical protein n=1 Tax=Simkania sp. TaxID=34094 RepID=UPI003B52B52C
MAAIAFPTIRLSIVAGEMGLASEPEKVQIVNSTVSPEINEQVVDWTKSLAKDHVFLLGQEFQKPAHARITFSVEHGVVFEDCDDPHLREIYLTNSRQVAVVPKSFADKHVCQIEPTPEMIESARAQTSEEVVFVDGISLALHMQGVTRPETVNLEIVPFIPLNKGRGLTTSSLRFPHMLLDLLKRQEQGKLTDDSSVCVVGPGLLEYEDPSVLPTCPQVAELLALFPQGNFTLLDRDKRALTLMAKQCAKNFMTYDTAAYRAYTMKDLPEFVENPEYQRLFEEMKRNFSQLTIAPSNADEMLDGFGGLKPLVLRVQKEQMAFRAFDITKSSFRTGEQFDVIVATLSIVNAHEQEIDKNPHGNHFGKLTKFLEALKVGGTLYLDASMIQRLVKVAGPEGFELGMKYLEASIGNRLEIEEVPLSSFKNDVKGSVNTISALSQHHPKGFSEHIYLTTTSTLWAITRSEEMVDPAQKGPVALQLLQLLQRQNLDERD